MIGDAPDAPVRVVRDVECAVRPNRESRRPVRRPARSLERTGEAVGEDHVWPCGLTIREWLEHHVVAALGERRPVPRAVEGDERPAPVGRRELLTIIEHEVVGRPVGGEGRDRASLLSAQPDFLPVAAVLRGEDQLLLGQVEIAIRPAMQERVGLIPLLIHAAANFASFFAFRGLSIKERTFCFIVWK